MSRYLSPLPSTHLSTSSPPDIRESPAIDVSRMLVDENAEVVVYDPKVRLETIHALGTRLSLCSVLCCSLLVSVLSYSFLAPSCFFLIFFFL